MGGQGRDGGEGGREAEEGEECMFLNPIDAFKKISPLVQVVRIQ